MRALVVRAAALSVTLFAACTSPVQSPAQAAGSAALYEGARLIVGDGSLIENAAFLVENNTFSAVGKKGEVQAPAGAPPGAGPAAARSGHPRSGARRVPPSARTPEFSKNPIHSVVRIPSPPND